MNKICISIAMFACFVFAGNMFNADGSINKESAEYKEAFSINSTGTNGASKYTIKVNGESIDYGTISFTDVPTQGMGWKAFADYPLTASVALVKGKNTVEMITDNTDLLYGTAQATAPMIDCLTFETAQTLSWGNAKGSQIL